MLTNCLNTSVSFAEKHRGVWFLSWWGPSPLTVICETQDLSIWEFLVYGKEWQSGVLQDSRQHQGWNTAVLGLCKRHESSSAFHWLLPTLAPSSGWRWWVPSPVTSLSHPRALPKPPCVFAAVTIQRDDGIKPRLTLLDSLKTQECIVENIGPEVFPSTIYTKNFLVYPSHIITLSYLFQLHSGTVQNWVTGAGCAMPLFPGLVNGHFLPLFYSFPVPFFHHLVPIFQYGFINPRIYRKWRMSNSETVTDGSCVRKGVQGRHERGREEKLLYPNTLVLLPRQFLGKRRHLTVEVNECFPSSDNTSVLKDCV